MPELPRGTVTLLFTDIEGSTRLLQELGRDRYVGALTEHRRVLREAFTRYGGIEVEMQGDSFHFAFASAGAAVAAAVNGQHALQAHEWELKPIRVRVGLHSGEPVQADGLYAGLDVHKAARVMSAAHGGQVLLSAETAALVLGDSGHPVVLRDLGAHRLKDFALPQRLFQLVVPGLRADFPPLRAAQSTTLPAAPTPLVGRTRELEKLEQLVAHDGVRLITLTGPGGTGKTRLALALADRLASQFADGAHFVQLAPLADPALVSPTIAATLEISADTDLEAALAPRRLLLVVDNFEHLLDAAPLLTGLLGAAAGLTLVATSRAPLRLQGEHEFPVPPLSLGESVTLLRARIAAHAPSSADDDNDILAEIAERLEGLPLALELAAARVRILGLRGLCDRLERALPLLTSGPRDAPERQRTLRATIEWSEDLLRNEEKRLFARLSVFAGGFTVDAAEAVCGGSLEALNALVDHALVRRRDAFDEPRLLMLRVIREHASVRLADSGEITKFAWRHAHWYMRLAEQASAELRGANQLEWQSRGEAELDNFRAALAFLLDSGDAESALRLASGVYPIWWLRGSISEGRIWLERAASVPGNVPDAARAGALYRLGTLQHQQGDDDPARRVLEEALALHERAGDQRGISVVCGRLGAIAARAGDYTEAVEYLETSLRLMRELDDQVGVAGSLLNLGDCKLMLGDHEMALSLAHEALEIFREAGERQGSAVALMNAALVELSRDDWEAAEPLVRASLEDSRALDYRLGEVYAAEALAAIAVGRGDAEAGTRLLGKAAAMRDQIEVELEPNERAVHDRAVDKARKLLGDARFAAIEEEGRSVPDGAVTTLLGTDYSHLAQT